MEESPVTARSIFFAVLLSFFVLIVIYSKNASNDINKVVFCNVGQGDASYVRLDHVDILIDAGPDSKVVNCLGRYMPAFDKKIELVIISHPQKDHYGGLSSVVKYYKISRIIINELDGKKTLPLELKNIIIKNNIYSISAYYNDSINISNGRIVFYWPTRLFTSADPNDLSMVFSLESSGFRLLYTGDITSKILSRLSRLSIGKFNVIKIPHHGSKYSLNKKFLQLADPDVAVISVSKNNSYGHPTHEVLDYLKAQNIKIKRTDLDGDIVFKLPN